MPQTEIRVYRDASGESPLTEWLDELEASQPLIYAKCVTFILELSRLGSELRRPHADFLRDGIYELRPKSGHVNYRILYFFNGKNIAILSHGCTKKDRVPDAEIERAVKRKKQVENDQKKYTAEWVLQ